LHGGNRDGSGRPKGAKNKRTAEREQEMEKAAERIAGILGENAFEGDAHALLMAVYKDQAQPLKARLDAAIAAIGYEKPRLSSVDATLDGNIGTYTAQPIPVEERDPLASTNGATAGGDQETPA
jgi:hypothetical protein